MVKRPQHKREDVLMKKSIFQMEVIIDTEEKSVQTHIGIDEKESEVKA